MKLVWNRQGIQHGTTPETFLRLFRVLELKAPGAGKF